MKPGYKTTEGIFTAIASTLSMLYALGVLGTHNGVADKIAAFAVTALTTAGYAVSRGMAKSAAPTAGTTPTP